ncbi:hypothetical protein PoB_000898300 [Plakobranchus ocellatus]|uniref:Uncharacterized protein n=1 Tax=Plakobranchus ocellatus TaxID=259542 RepID=A0AAV3YJT7_9GAST|nr:hypothetical protein PoB_000898300 [Plakobranchus ocellatus]
MPTLHLRTLLKQHKSTCPQQGDIRLSDPGQARAPMVELEPATEGSQQISGGLASHCATEAPYSDQDFDTVEIRFERVADWTWCEG